MGEKKDVRRVKRAIRKLEKAVKKGTVNRLQREFAATTEGLRTGVLHPPKLFKDIEMRDTVEDTDDNQ